MLKNAFCGWPARGGNHRITKTLLVMKLTIVLLTAAFLNVSANGISQSVTFSGKNVSLDKVFNEVEKQTGYGITYKGTILNDTKPVSVTAENLSLEKFLDLIFKDQPIKYTIRSKTILLSRKFPTVIVSSDRPSASADASLPPLIDVHGHILNEDGKPAAGVTVTVKGTKNAVMTDDNGYFTIRGVDENAVLEISSMGYATQAVKVNGGKNIVVQLKKSLSKLDEVQVIAYGTTTKRLNTGNVNTIASSEIEKQPINNPLQAIQGRVPGLIITQQTGLSGGGFAVQIRGRNSIANGNNPLYIIDGIPFPSAPINSTFSNGILNRGNPLSYLNPQDIASIEVLKDADATAIYGSRGANGVILITTKKGRIGKTQVILNLSKGIGEVPKKMELLSTQEYLEMRHEAFTNDNQAMTISNAKDILVWDTTTNIDWQKVLIGGTMDITNSQVSISGGNNNTQFLLSANYSKESTVFPGNFGTQKSSVNFSASNKSHDGKLKTTFTGNFNSNNNNLLSRDLTSYITLPPDAPIPITDSTGEINWGPSNALFTTNPFAFLRQKYIIKGSNLIGNVQIGYSILPGLEIRSNFGYNQLAVKNTATFPKTANSPNIRNFTNSSATYSDNSIKSWIAEPLIEYTAYVFHNRFKVLAGSTFQQTKNEWTEFSATGFASEDLLENIGSASSVSVPFNLNSDYRYSAVFSRVSYNINDKYLINLSTRRDGSSRFGPGKRFANFSSIGAAWIFSSEKFIQIVPQISFGKIRVSYGTSGNDQIPEYGYFDTYTSTFFPYNGVAGLIPARLYNDQYSWEVNKKLELGFEFGLFKDRILFSGSWYKGRSSSQLVGYPLPQLTGFSSILANLPATIENTSWEFLINTININSNNFQWNSSFNLTIPKNKLRSYPNIFNSAYSNIYEVGKSIFIQRKFNYLNVDAQSGLYTFNDINKDGNISYPDDLQGRKTIAQIFYGGLQNNFSFKRLDVSFLFQFVKQYGKNYLSLIGSAPGMMNNQPRDVLNRWQRPGDIAPVEQFTQSTTSAYFAWQNARNLGDNTIDNSPSFIRLKNLSISYRFSDSVFKGKENKALSIYFQAQNLFTFTKYKGLDPENQSLSFLPPLRILSFGIQLTL